MTQITPKRLAVVVSHPIQYYSPWFRHLATRPEIDLKVFYLWDFGIKEKKDEKFGTAFSWDIPLLDGYKYELLENSSADPGTHHFKGLDNPQIIEKLNDWAPEAILLFGYNYASHMRVLRSKQLAKIPIIFRGDSHNLYPTKGIKPIIARLLRSWTFRRFSRVLSVGTANEDYFKTCGVPQQKLIRAAHCVDNDRFQKASDEANEAALAWRKELGIPEDSFVFLFAGKFESKKRPTDLLAAFKKLNNPNTSLLLIGGGDFEEELHKNANDQVFFAPFQNQSQMPKVYATGDVLVLPSFGRGETWGLAVNEAMNLSRPTIVSSHVGCGLDLVLDEVTGWVFEAGDVGDLTKAMERASSNPERTAKMGPKARSHVSKFSYEAAGEAVVLAMKELTH